MGEEERERERETRLFGWSNGHPVSIAHQMTNRTSSLREDRLPWRNDTDCHYDCRSAPNPFFAACQVTRVMSSYAVLYDPMLLCSFVDLKFLNTRCDCASLYSANKVRKGRLKCIKNCGILLDREVTIIAEKTVWYAQAEC